MKAEKPVPFEKVERLVELGLAKIVHSDDGSLRVVITEKGKAALTERAG